MHDKGGHDRRLMLWLSLAQRITWSSVFYTFAMQVLGRLLLGMGIVSMLALALAQRRSPLPR